MNCGMGPIATASERTPAPLAYDRLLKLNDVKEVVGLGKTFIYKLIQEGQFPAPYKPGGTASRWSENEISDWLSACASQRLQ